MPDSGNRDLDGASLAADSQSTEQKMRRALGLNTKAGSQTPQQRPEQARARHRFVQDGGVPVTVLNPRHDGESSQLRERIAELEHQLDHERQTHAATRRSLGEQQAACQALETRLVHADLAHQDAIAQERALRLAAQEALAAAAAAATSAASSPATSPTSATSPTASSATPRRAARTEPAPVEHAIPPVKRARVPAAAIDAPKPKRGRPRINPVPEPKPVRWWTPSFRAKKP